MRWISLKNSSMTGASSGRKFESKSRFSTNAT